MEGKQLVADEVVAWGQVRRDLARPLEGLHIGKIMLVIRGFSQFAT